MLGGIYAIKIRINASAEPPPSASMTDTIIVYRICGGELAAGVVSERVTYN